MIRYTTYAQLYAFHAACMAMGAWKECNTSLANPSAAVDIDGRDSKVPLPAAVGFSTYIQLRGLGHSVQHLVADYLSALHRHILLLTSKPLL